MSANIRDSILKRINSKMAGGSLLSQLIQMEGADLKSLLIHVFQERASRRVASDMIDRYQRNPRFLGVSELNQRELVRFDSLFYEIVPSEFCAVELSPVSPLGLNGILAKISQNCLLSTGHHFEVLGDPTTPLALESALRRKRLLAHDAKSPEDVHLSTAQRILRVQPFDPGKGYMQHFKCFGLSSQGTRPQWKEFVIEQLMRHLKVYLDFIRRLNADSFSINEVVVSLSHAAILEAALMTSGWDRQEVIRNTGNPDYRLFERCGITLPPIVEDPSSISNNEIEKYGINEAVELLSDIHTSVVQPLCQVYPEVQFQFSLSRVAGIGYYTGTTFHIHGCTDQGLVLQLADGGFTDWAKKLLNNRREFLLISGFGADLIHKMFRKSTIEL